MRLGRDVNNFLSLYLVYGVYTWCTVHAPCKRSWRKKNKQDTAGHRYNEGPRDWQNLFAIKMFRYIKVLSCHILIIQNI